MPLNYSKWDALEVSDDSDIEGHPNVDHKSLVRMKQRQIHEQREQRKVNIAHLQAQIDCNNVLLPRIKEFAAALSSESAPLALFNSHVEQLQQDPSKDCPPGNDSSRIEQTYDGMLINLYRQVVEDCKNKVSSASVPPSERDEKLGQAITAGIQFHCIRLKETIDDDAKELEEEIKEQKKHITSDDLHDGFSSKYTPSQDEPVSIPTTKIGKPTKQQKSTKTEFEVLNPGTIDQNTSTVTPPPGSDTEEDDDEEAMPELTPGLVGFSKLPVLGFSKSFEYIQKNRDVVVDGASDALLVAAFRAESRGEVKYAEQCVHQSLVLQYCEKLGKDGVGVFFRRMTTGNKIAEKVFVDDFRKTYGHLKERVRISKEEEETAASGREQIQLVPENPATVISFNVPDGPPPEELVLEGPGTENFDIGEVRKALQMRWDIFSAFDTKLQEALRGGSLEEVNKVLGSMDVDAATAVVESLDMGGILNFAEGGIRDETATEQ